jgi:MoxR-like ATPase
MKQGEIKEQDLQVEIKSIVWKEERKNKVFQVPWYGKLDIDIQTVSDEALEKIITEREYFVSNIPKKKEVITIDQQSDYYKEVKQQIIDRLLTRKFAIVQWPTGTWKTTIVKTIWYEMQLPVYEVWADAEKTIDDFLKEIKTYKKWNMLQIKELPWLLIKAITKWWIFLINEANTLQPDIQIALANMLESGFVIVWTKKYIVHPNFSLVFTSNEGYAWTNSYNKAVVRKGWWIVNFDYEPDLEWELKIVQTIYDKLKQNFKCDKELKKEDLEKITNFVRKFRELIREYNKVSNLEDKFLSQDLNDAWHFLYIRFYEKFLKDILTNEDNIIDIKKLWLENFNAYLQDKIVGFSPTWEYIDHFNNKKKLSKIFNETIKEEFIVKIENAQENPDDKIELNPDLLEGLSEVLPKDELTEIIDLSELNKEEKKVSERKKNGFTKKGINPNLFSKVLDREIKSNWEKLKRVDNIEKLVQDIYEKLVESHRKKIIWEIAYTNHEIYGPVVWVEINWEKIGFKAKDWKQIDLSSIKTEEEVLNKLFWNDNVEIVYEDEVFENMFAHPKSLEIRRFSKMIDYGDKIVFLWFRWEVRDIRYKWEESWKYYIPQSKVNDLLLSTYRVLNIDEIENIKKGHYLIINSLWELEFKTIEKIKERIWNWENIRVLKKEKDKDLEKEIRNRFSNVDKFNLHNWVEEKAETWVPLPIYGSAYSIQRAIENELSKNFEYIPESTNKLIDQIIKYLNLGENILLIWPSGVGKSSIVKEVAKRKKLPYIDLQITDNLQESDLQSQLRWNEWELEDMFTPFLDYWVNGGIVELKELNMASVLTFLNNFLDENGIIVINDKEYRKHPDFHVIATINPFDNRIYNWTTPLNLAVQARFKTININYLEKEEEKRTLLEIARIYNKERLINEWLEKNLEEILNFVVYPIRTKIDELRVSQSMWTDEWLKILAEKNITIDILIRWIKTANTIEDIKKYLKEHLYLEKEKLDLLPEDIRQVFKMLK